VEKKSKLTYSPSSAHRVGQAGTELSRVTEEFNEMFGGDSNHVAWHWFFPLPVEFPRGMQKVVMGYEWDETFDAVAYEEPQGNGDVEMGTTSAAADDRLAASTLSNKEKSSEHNTPDDPNIVPAQSFSSPPVNNGRGRTSRLVKRGNSRDRCGDSNDPPIQGTLT
jgi:hypothetical protein